VVVPRGEVSELKTQVADLTLRLDTALSRIDQLSGMVWKGSKKKGGEARPKAALGKRAGSFRPDPPEASVTALHSFFLDTCPDCGGEVGPANRVTTAYQEDIVLPPPPSVEQYQVGRHWCTRCQRHVKHPDAPDLYRIRRIGPAVLGFILYAKYRLGLTLPKIQESLKSLHGFLLSEGEIVWQLHEASTLFGAEYTAICEHIAGSSHVHADETGWRVEGENWWLWVFASPEGSVRYQLNQSRGREVAKGALGENSSHVVSSDFYSAYTGLQKAHQYCWAHLAREAKACSPSLYSEVSTLYISLREQLLKPVAEREGRRLHEAFLRIAQTEYQDSLTGMANKLATLRKRLARHTSDYLTCLRFEGIPPDNNRAERLLRQPQVIQRKISGGCRSKQGAETHAVNSSVLATLKERAEAPFFEALQTLVHTKLAGECSAMG